MGRNRGRLSKILPNRLHSFFYYLDYVVKQVDQETGRFRKTWQPGRGTVDLKTR
jgi:hypothetical protein